MERYKILVVDDEPDLVAAVAKLISATVQADIISTCSPSEAIHILFKEHIALLLCDMEMPEFDGNVVLALARKSNPNIVSILFTARTGKESIIEAINKGGIWKYLAKPFKSSELARMIQVDINKGISVLGFSSNRDDVIVNGQGSTYCFSLSDANALLAHVTVTNGKTTITDRPGGVYMYVGTMSNCVVTGCEAPYGGGVLFDSKGTVVTSTISYNNSTSTVGNEGGGGVAFRNTSGRLLDSHIIGNTSSNDGGGVHTFLSYTNFVSNCVIMNNYALGNGGGIRGVGIIIDTIIRSNRANGTGGGGIVVKSGGHLTIRNSTIAGNFATNGLGWGGGITRTRARSPETVIDRCVISNNISKHGGGVYSYTGLTLSNSTIAGNTATALDGAGGVQLNAAGADQKLWNCVISGNVGNRPGGLCILGNAPSVYGCLIAGNRCTNSAGYAGGIYITNGVVENCAIVSNQASGTGEGGGLYCKNGGKIRNTIIYGNMTGTATSSNWYNSGSGMAYTNCVTMPTNSLPGTGNISADPLCVNFADGNYRLARRSPCINAGVNQDWMTNAFNLDGRARIFSGLGTNVDVGAYEYFVNRGTIFTGF